MTFLKAKTNFLKNYCDTKGLTQGDYYCRIYLDDINLPSSEVITKENVLRLEAMGGTNFHLHPQILYRTTYVNSIDNQTTLSISLPRLNYYEKDQNGNNVKHFKDVRLLLLPSTTLDNINPAEEIDEQVIIDTCIPHANQSGYNYYLSNSKFTPELFDSQHIECHLMTFNQKIPKGTYVGFLVYQDSDGNYHLFDPIPKVKDAYPKIQITATKPEVDTTQLPTAINVKTLSLNDLQTKKISITIKDDYFAGKQIDPDTGDETFTKWIKVMKGEEEILPLTRITTRYDNNNQIITEVTEDYDRNEVKITIPLYYLFGLTEKPTQLPELEKGDYKIQIYTLNTASTPISTIQIKANDMPFVLKFYHHDHLGTVRYITNESGEILHTTDTLAYGEELTAPYEDTNDKVLNTITYTGHEKDYETNLTYMMARYYSQGYGRFLSPDPGYDYDQLDPMSWNLYSYVRGNPVNAMDNNGRYTLFINGIDGHKLKILEDKAEQIDPAEGGKAVQAYGDTLNPDGSEKKFRWLVINPLKVLFGGPRKDIQKVLNKLRENKDKKTLNIIAHSGGGIVALKAAYKAIKEGIKINEIILIDAPTFTFLKHKLRAMGVHIRSYYTRSDPVSWLAAIVDAVLLDWSDLFKSSHWVKTSTWFISAHGESVYILSGTLRITIYKNGSMVMEKYDQEGWSSNSNQNSIMGSHEDEWDLIRQSMRQFGNSL